MATLRLVELPLQMVEVPDNIAAVETRVFTTIVPVAVTVDALASTVTVRITGQSGRMAPFGVLGFAMGDTVSAQVTQTLEPI